MLFWWLIEIFTTTLHFDSTEIPDDAQNNDELYTFSNFFNQGTTLWFDSRNICNISSVCFTFITAVTNYMSNIGC